MLKIVVRCLLLFFVLVCWYDYSSDNRDANYDDVLSVLALFDDNDIFYIKSDTYLKFKDRYLDEKEKKQVKIKVKKRSDNND